MFRWQLTAREIREYEKEGGEDALTKLEDPMLVAIYAQLYELNQREAVPNPNFTGYYHWIYSYMDCTVMNCIPLKFTQLHLDLLEKLIIRSKQLFELGYHDNYDNVADVWNGVLQHVYFKWNYLPNPDPFHRERVWDETLPEPDFRIFAMLFNHGAHIYKSGVNANVQADFNFVYAEAANEARSHVFSRFLIDRGATSMGVFKDEMGQRCHRDWLDDYIEERRGFVVASRLVIGMLKYKLARVVNPTLVRMDVARLVAKHIYSCRITKHAMYAKKK